jgi:diacylglycerol O-acyltransferase / trehalose O-mycolyltransferase
MRRLWAVGAAILVCQALGGAPVMAQSPSAPPGITVVTGRNMCGYDDYPVIRCAEQASDPRVSGMAKRTITLEPESPDQGALMWDDILLTGPEGTWTGTGYGVMEQGGETHNLEIMSGGGAYQGLVYATWGTVGPNGDATYTGLIQPGTVPPGFPVPLPEPVASPSPLPSLATRGQAADDGARIVTVETIDGRTRDLTIESPSVGTVKVRLLLPSTFDSDPATRFPVLYLLHGAAGGHAEWTLNTDVEALTAPTDLLVVMPDANDANGAAGWYTDWYNGGTGGTPKWETFHLTELRQLLERNWQAGDQRVIAGLSMGGYGAITYAARHPDLFKAAASYSGVLDLKVDPTDFSQPNDITRWGDPATNAANWDEHDPIKLVPSLNGMLLYIAYGNGEPGPLDSAGSQKDDLEAWIGRGGDLFVAALKDAGIPATVNAYGPGTHSWPYWQRELHASLPMLLRALGESGVPPSPTPEAASSSASPAPPPTPAPAIELSGFSIRPFGVGYVTVAHFAVDGDGDIYLPGGTEGSAVVRIAPDGHVLARWAGLDVVPGQPDTIAGIAVDPASGDVWASDVSADRIVHLTPDLVEVARWGATGPEQGQSFGPGGLAIDGQGNIVVADMGNDRVQTFTPDGELVGVIDAPGGKTVPVDVSVDPGGDLLVSTVQPLDWAGRVLRVSPDGANVEQLKPGAAPQLLYPDAVVDTAGNVLVGDALNGLFTLDPKGKQVGGAIHVPGSGTSAYAVRVATSGDVYTLACGYQSSDCTLARLSATGQVLATWHDAEPVTQLGQAYPVSGHQLYLQCVGSGSPTIVWTSGAQHSGWTETQQLLMGQLAPTARFCTWDRLGQGFSDPSQDDDMLHWWEDVEDLHGLLAAAGETGPYVMAGYSYGGLLARLFTYAHPDEVVGLLAVDPGHEDEWAGPVDPGAPLGVTSCTDASCPFFADIEKVHQMTGGTVAGSLGDLPLVVLSHDPTQLFSSPEYDAYWQQLGADTATASSNAVHITSSWSGHPIPYAHPGLVVEALEQLVAAARAGDHTLPACGTAFTELGGVCQ